MLKNPYFRVAVFTFLLVGTLASASAIKVWAAGDQVQVSDLNSNFQHMHNSMVGGHGGRLLNADVNSSANIAYTKLQNGRGIARAYVGIVSCTGAGACSMTNSSSMNVTGVSRSATAGDYTVTLNYTASDTAFATVVNAGYRTSIGANILCQSASLSTTTISVKCLDYTGAPAAADSAFSLVVYDDN